MEDYKVSARDSRLAIFSSDWRARSSISFARFNRRRHLDLATRRCGLGCKRLFQYITLRRVGSTRHGGPGKLSAGALSAQFNNLTMLGLHVRLPQPLDSNQFRARTVVRSSRASDRAAFY